ncbi:MAG: hypothetical protein KHY72_10030 [Streptococcus agalactiae]|nr:hypothetical protein [Streptococcus agalactiae]
MKRLTECFNRRTYEKARRLKEGCKKIDEVTCISGCPYKIYCSAISVYFSPLEKKPIDIKTSALGRLIEDAEDAGAVSSKDWINTYKLIK